MIPSHFYCLVFSFVVDLGLTRVQECREESFILSAMSSVKQRNCILSAYPVMFVTLKAFSSFLFAHIAVFCERRAYEKFGDFSTDSCLTCLVFVRVRLHLLFFLVEKKSCEKTSASSFPSSQTCLSP